MILYEATGEGPAQVRKCDLPPTRDDGTSELGTRNLRDTGTPVGHPKLVGRRRAAVHTQTATVCWPGRSTSVIGTPAGTPA